MQYADKHRHCHVVFASGFLTLLLVCLVILCIHAASFLPATKRTGVEHSSAVGTLVQPGSSRKALQTRPEKSGPTVELVFGPDPAALIVAGCQFAMPKVETACLRPEKPTFLSDRLSEQGSPRAPPFGALLAGA